MLKISIGLFVLVSYAACAWPGGQQVIDRKPRGFTVIHDEIENSNNETRYAFSYKIANRPSYFYPQTVVTAAHKSPNITITRLRLNEILSFRVCNYQLGTTVSDDLFSPYTNITVKSTELVGNTLVPGPPLNLEVLDNGSQKSHTAIVNWDDPQNIQDSTNDIEKDIQYTLEICRYNRFNQKKSGCKIEAEILRNLTTTRQSTQNEVELYRFDFQPEKSDEFIYRVTGIAMNGTAGPTAEVVKRLNQAGAPQAPYNVTSGLHAKYADELTLSWMSVEGVNYVKYNIKGNSTTMMKSGSSPMVVTGLMKNTTYEFQVGVYTENEGGSEYSAKYTTTTTDEPKPTPKPGSSGTMLTSSLFLLLSSVFAVLKFL